MASIVITEATPMMIPSIVRNPRSLLLAKARRAIFSKFVVFIVTSVYRLIIILGQAGQSLGGAQDIRIHRIGGYMTVAQRDIPAAVLGDSPES